MTRLGEGELDLAFVRLPCESSKAFELKILDREPMVVALHRTHPLAGQPSLTLAQLNTTPVILFPRTLRRGFMTAFTAAASARGLICNTRYSLPSFHLPSAW
jgi:DNA-binding transcriptional LysR family regulator